MTTLASPSSTHRIRYGVLHSASVPRFASLLVLGMVTSTSGRDVLRLRQGEGETKYLSVWSTSQILASAEVQDVQTSGRGTFVVFIQLGAILALCSYFARDLLAQARAGRHAPTPRRFPRAIARAFLGAAIIGLLLCDWIKRVRWGSPTTIAAAAVLGGVTVLNVEQLPLRASVHEERAINLGQARGMGRAQPLALLPGASHSVASMGGGMRGALNFHTATAISFYPVIPILGLAPIVNVFGNLDQRSTYDVSRLLLGMLVAMFVAWLPIGWLLRYVAYNSVVVFGMYRLAAGLVILQLSAAARL